MVSMLPMATSYDREGAGWRWVYRVLMVEAAEVIWLLDPFLPFLFTWTYRPPNSPIKLSGYISPGKKGWLCVGTVCAWNRPLIKPTAQLPGLVMFRGRMDNVHFQITQKH